MDDGSVGLAGSPTDGRAAALVERHAEQEHSPRFEHATELLQRPDGFRDVLHHVLRDQQVERRIAEREILDRLVSQAALIESTAREVGPEVFAPHRPRVALLQVREEGSELLGGVDRAPLAGLEDKIDQVQAGAHAAVEAAGGTDQALSPVQAPDTALHPGVLGVHRKDARHAANEAESVHWPLLRPRRKKRRLEARATPTLEESQPSTDAPGETGCRGADLELHSTDLSRSVLAASMRWESDHSGRVGGRGVS